jgi:hypothetical protein
MTQHGAHLIFCTEDRYVQGEWPQLDIRTPALSVFPGISGVE